MSDKKTEQYRETVTNEPILSPEDELLVKSFFDSHPMTVEDNGFTRKVMRQLPQDTMLLNRLWTVICTIAGILLLVTGKGWKALPGIFNGIWADLLTNVIYQQNTLIIYLTLIALLMIGGYQVVTSEKRFL